MNVRIANAPCSWGVMGGFDKSKFPPPRQVLAEIAETGYEGTELGEWGYLPTDQGELKPLLEEAGLKLVGALVPLGLADPALHDPGIEAALRTARLLAACGTGAAPGPFVILADANGEDETRVRHAGRINERHAFTDDQWSNFAVGANAVARAVLQSTGLRTIFHHHCGGFIETPRETARLMEMTDPGLLGLCFDTGHYAYGGGDVLAGYRQHAERVWHVHFKDCHPKVVDRAIAENWDYFTAVTNGVFFGLGGGSVDFPALIDEMRETGYSGWIVVEDELAPGLGNAKDSAMRDRDFMRGLGI